MEIVQTSDKLINQIRRDIFYLIKKSYNIKNVDNYNDIFSDIVAYVELLDELNQDCDDIFKYILPETRKENRDRCIKKHFCECKKTMDFDQKIIEHMLEFLQSSYYFHGNFDKMTRKVSKDKMFEMTFDFLEKHKPCLSNQLNNMLKEERIILLKDFGQPYNGKTISSTIKFSPYVIIYLLNNIIDVSTLIHEIGHVYQYQKQEQHRYNQVYKSIYNNQLEVYSHYLELLSYDSFLDNFEKKDILNLKRLMVKNFIENYINLELYLNVFDKENYYENYDEYSSDYSYARGMLLAFEFYHMYIKDKEKAEYNIDRFITESGKYDFLTTINKYDLNREHLESGIAIKKYIKQIF